MRMPRRPGQHTAGDAEVIVVAWKRAVDGAALAHLGLQIGELAERLLAHRPLRPTHTAGRHLAMKLLDQTGAADRVDQHLPRPTGRHSKFMPSPWAQMCSPITRGPKVSNKHSP